MPVNPSTVRIHDSLLPEREYIKMCCTCAVLAKTYMKLEIRGACVELLVFLLAERFAKKISNTTGQKLLFETSLNGTCLFCGGLKPGEVPGPT